MFARVNFFKNLKGQHSLNCKKTPFQRLKKTNVAYPYRWVARCTELIAESPFASRTTIADNFPSLPSENEFCNL
jgi:hypothetical protein